MVLRTEDSEATVVSAHNEAARICMVSVHMLQRKEVYKEYLR